MLLTQLFYVKTIDFCCEQESSLNVEAVEQTYWRNPILRYTQHPLHSPLLPLPYGNVNVHCKC